MVILQERDDARRERAVAHDRVARVLDDHNLDVRHRRGAERVRQRRPQSVQESHERGMVEIDGPELLLRLVQGRRQDEVEDTPLLVAKERAQRQRDVSEIAVQPPNDLGEVAVLEGAAALRDEPLVRRHQRPRLPGITTLFDRLIHRLPFEIPRRDFPRRAAGFEPVDDLPPVVPTETDADLSQENPPAPPPPLPFPRDPAIQHPDANRKTATLPAPPPNHGEMPRVTSRLSNASADARYMDNAAETAGTH